MPKVTVEFNKSSLMYFPGETVSGVIVIDCDSEQTTHGQIRPAELIDTSIQILFVGEANTHVFTKSNKKAKSSRVGPEVPVGYEYERFDGPYQGTETIVSNLLQEFPDLFILMVGRNKVRFSYDLPKNIPCSFEGECGHISYGINVEIKQSVSTQIDKTRNEIQVLPVCDLNTDLTVMEPAEETKNRTRSFCESLFTCGKLDPSFTATLKTYRTGFCVGEPILFQCGITNSKSRAVKVYKVSLNQVVTYRANVVANDDIGETRTQLILAVERPGSGELFSENQDLWAGELGPIPFVPPTKLGGNCKIITVNYELTLHLTFDSGCFNSNDLDVNISVSIGTISLSAQTSRSATNETVSISVRSSTKGDKKEKDEKKKEKKEKDKSYKEERRRRNAERRKKKAEKRKWEEEQRIKKEEKKEVVAK